MPVSWRCIVCVSVCECEALFWRHAAINITAGAIVVVGVVRFVCYGVDFVIDYRANDQIHSNQMDLVRCAAVERAPYEISYCFNTCRDIILGSTTTIHFFVGVTITWHMFCITGISQFLLQFGPRFG